MARDRKILGKILREICPNVYFQPPETVRLNYPCIIYNRISGDTQFGSNKPYVFEKRYQITIIDPDPDSEIVDKIARLPMCVMDRHYTVDNFNHDVFNLYF